ncbi:riboflavin synthase [Hyphobacterium sp.]|uniref:riboflavin synthase n=1 Tax=Hyphobacterium sp. TaxID=2004662 RepID=UPI003BA8FC6F
MFTGIVDSMGVVREVSGSKDRRFVIESDYDPDNIALGASIAHAGACLTVVEVSSTTTGASFVVEVSPETLDRTTLGDWVVGSRINLERSLKMGDELGGHLVTGHVDGLGEVVLREDQGDWLKLGIRAPSEFSKFIAEKGSIAVEGVSLTVNGVNNDVFDLMIIPHTAKVTTLGGLQIGARVNLEVDLMARYAARLMQAES